MLLKAKLALRITTNDYDSEIADLIDAAKLDLGIAGVKLPDVLDTLCERAILTYVRLNFGSPPDYDRLKASYDEQKGQLKNATGYTDWGVLP
ncbi:MAG: DNA-packaging protein [Oscillospiraceae bacterium]|nr:DNA-packaging protein [Oscillospiraceae bacterium]